MKSDEFYLSIPSWKGKSTGKGNFFLDLNGFSVTGKMNSFEGKTECGSIYKAINMRHQEKKRVGNSGTNAKRQKIKVSHDHLFRSEIKHNEKN